MVRYRHPYMLSRAVNWDEALVAVVPLASQARQEKDVVNAIAAMLRHLGDPITRVVVVGATAASAPVPAGPVYSARRGKTLLVDLTRPVTQAQWPDRIEEIRSAMENAKAIIFDLRVREAGDGFLMGLHLAKLLPDLLSRDVVLPGERSVLHVGYRSQTGPGPVGQSQLVSTPPEQLRAAAGIKRRRVAFVLNAQSGAPTLALALQASGDGLVITQDADLEEQLVATTMPITGTHDAIVMRVREVSWPDGQRVAANVSLPADAPAERALSLATDWVNGDKLPASADQRSAPRNASPDLARWLPDASYPGMQPPDHQHRLLSLFKLSAVVEWFFPYRSLMDRPWEQTVDEFIPRFEAADTERAYELAVASLAARLDDGHVTVRGGQELERLFGRAPPPFFARMIEGHPVVTALRDVGAAEAGRVKIGDVLRAIDGVPVLERMRKLEPYVAASNAAWRQFATLERALLGPEGSTARVEVERPGGRVEVLSVPRRGEWWLRAQRSRPMIEVLPGNVGYVDLDRLQLSEIRDMLDRLKNTRGIVFDMRGYPHMTGGEIAARLNKRRAAVGALYRCPVVRGAGGEPGDALTFEAPIPGTDQWIYGGKSALLIDERTMSQAEGTGLMLEAAAGTKFVGSTTAGANGDATSLILPGGLAVTFTGQEVKHADGRQLQRVGLRPDVEVHPTLRGLRAGRDEVLDRAVRLLRN
jgi:C-terminal processing protease CtpA/Prc